MPDPVDIERLWRRLETRLSVDLRGPSALNAPVSRAAIADAESAMSVELPAAFVASLLRHDGQSGKVAPLLGRWSLLPLSQVVHKWLILGDTGASDDDSDCVFTEGPVRPRLWDRYWVPFAAAESGDYLVLDLNPPASGTSGQVVTWSRHGAWRRVVAPSFSEWLLRTLDELERASLAPAQSEQSEYRKLTPRGSA